MLARALLELVYCMIREYHHAGRALVIRIITHNKQISRHRDNHSAYRKHRNTAG